MPHCCYVALLRMDGTDADHLIPLDNAGLSRKNSCSLAYALDHVSLLAKML